MKKIICLMSLILVFATTSFSKAQSLDTLSVLQEKIISHKSDYIGQPFSKLLKDIPFKILSYIDRGSLNNRHITFGTEILFVSPDNWNKSIKKVHIELTWETPLKHDETLVLEKQTKFNWNQDAVNYFSDKVVGEIKVYKY